MLVQCSIENPIHTLETTNNTFYDNTYSNAIVEFNRMLNVSISIKNSNSYLGGILWFLKEVHKDSTIGLKGSKDFVDILRMLRILNDSNPISISDEIYSIKGINISELFYIIENNQDNNMKNLRTFIRKKKLKEIMENV